MILMERADGRVVRALLAYAVGVVAAEGAQEVLYHLHYIRRIDYGPDNIFWNLSHIG